ncbi:MAG: hypothetical protein LC745_08670, partial [Planctomycetia bacterium]|nr:hypothetical protein [Planctomycetia bacterium]
MAVVPVKFRCYRCNQLLGVSPSKVGAVVACPRCSADLVVPDPNEADQPSTGEEPVGPDGSPPPSPASSPFIPPETEPEDEGAGVPLDFLNIRPEDIRVEPGVRHPARTVPMPSPGRVEALPAVEPEAVIPAPRPVVPETVAATQVFPARGPVVAAPTVRVEALAPVAAIDRCRLAQQPREASALLKSFPSRDVAADLDTQVRELRRT